MRSRTRLGLALLLLALTSGCVHRVATAPPGSGVATTEPPLGMVEANFISEHSDQTWSVEADGEPLCATPCTRKVSATASLLLKARDGDRAWVPSLTDVAPGTRRALVVVQGSHEGEAVNGIVWTTFGGMGAVVAITLSAVGCSNVAERGGLCTAGLITGAVSLPLTAIAIWMIVDAQPTVHVLRVGSPVASGRAAGAVSVSLTPTGVFGRF